MPLDQNNESVILFDSNGVEMSVANGVAIPAGQRGLVVLGSDGANLRFLRTDATGAVVTLSTAASDEPTFVASAPAVAVASNKSMISIVNVNAIKRVKLREIWIVNAQTAAVTGVVGLFELHRITGHSVGTLLTVLPYDTADAADVDISCRTGATVAGESASVLSRWRWSTDDWGPGTPDVEGIDHTFQQLTPAYSPQLNEKPLTASLNQGFTIKFATASTAGTFDLKLVFTVV